MDATIAIPTRGRRNGWIAAGLAALTAGVVGFPFAGVPLALGIGTYAAIKLSKPHQIVRGRTLSRRQQQRAALFMGSGMFGIAASFSGVLLTLDLANTLEHRLHQALKTAHHMGELRLGQIFEECESAVCARATVIALATPNTVGIAKLSGVAMHEHTIYHWRDLPRASDGNTAQR